MNPMELERLAETVGGRPRLVALVQRRLRDLTRGETAKTDAGGRNLIDVALEEIRQGKIPLDPPREEERHAGRGRHPERPHDRRRR